ncbi:MAG: hydrophobic/amphiphilic exporter (mainly bacteria), family [Acidobacteriota bacterium]|jgi:HAE1 family hydrophobic/amphiphilic exporter-1|nr:hydrophobic/amphiphilic exporter (mainly bacteria), family [Acidobacteriota bacterium]
MNLPKLAVSRPVTTLMVLVSVLVLGGIAWSRLPLAFLPDVDAPFIGIQIPYPNSNPTQIEKEITKPVEEALATLSGVKKLRSRSTADGAEINMEFDWGKNLDIVRMQVGEKMDQVKPTLPEGVGQVLIFSFSTSDIPVIEGRIAAEGVDLSQNFELLEARVANRIRRVEGVARVGLHGVAPREISIDLVLDKVKAHNVDIGGLIGRLQGASQNLVLGQVDSGGLRYTARALGAFASIEAIEELPVNDRGLRLRDIAEIRYEEPPSDTGRHLDGDYAVALDVFKESTANTVEVATAVRKVIEEDIDKDPLLKGVKLFVFDDQAKQITDAIDGLTSSGMIGGLLAVLILYFFLRRLDSTLIVSLSIPFSVIAACGAMYFLGKTLNILSMMGLMLGVGMLVDNAIVVLESIDCSQREERDPKKAALAGASHVWLAVTASTCTTLIVFLPLILGASNQLTIFLKEVGIALSLAMVASLFSSLTLIPLVSAHFLKVKPPKPVPSVAWMEERYARMLGWTLRHRKATGALVVVGIASGFVPFALDLVQTGMFSATTNERLRINYEFADFSYKSDSERAVNQVESFLNANAERFLVKGLYSFFVENEAGTTITLARPDLSDTEMQDLRSKLRDSLPKIPGVRLSFEDDSAEAGGSSTFFAVKLFGQDSEVLGKLAEETERRLATVKGVEDITSPMHRGRREVQVTVDRDKAMRLGMSAQDISNLFSFTLGGMRLRRFNAGDHEVETWLALRQEDRTSLEDLKRMQVTSAGGTPVLLGDIASFQVITREQEIQRENRKVKTEVRAVYEGDDWDGSKERIGALMDAFDLPPGYSWSWDDRILEQDGQGQQMAVNFLLALALVYLVMASLFESLAQPFAILFSIPFALPGAVWLLAATRTPFNMMAQIGLLILMGVVVNNGIVLLDHLNQLRAAGVPRDEAIIQAGRDRLRPVLMTAATTVLGLLPLAWGGAAVGDLFYYPLARTVMGGLMSSSVLTLLVLPYITLGVEGFAAWMRSLWSGSAAKPVVPVETVEA